MKLDLVLLVCRGVVGLIRELLIHCVMLRVMVRITIFFYQWARSGCWREFFVGVGPFYSFLQEDGACY